MPPMPSLFIKAVKDICTINTFELLNILFSEVNCLHFGFTTRLFPHTTNDMSIYEVWKLFHCWPLVFGSFFLSPLVARDVVTPFTESFHLVCTPVRWHWSNGNLVKWISLIKQPIKKIVVSEDKAVKSMFDLKNWCSSKVKQKIRKTLWKTGQRQNLMLWDIQGLLRIANSLGGEYQTSDHFQF